MRTRKAISDCAKWLAGCLEDGWDKSKLKDLEALWWEHHDASGNIKEVDHETDTD